VLKAGVRVPEPERKMRKQTTSIGEDTYWVWRTRPPGVGEQHELATAVVFSHE
jgi:hypothetical protein